VVFDRRIDGDSAGAVEFGVSGLMVDSTTVYFDRRSEAARESLWPQLAFKAISGPAAGKAMTLVPYQLMSWQQWQAIHPDTRVLLGLRTHKTEYGSDPYSVYMAESDDLRFPTVPYWNVPGVPKKTRIVAVSSDQVKWKVLREGTASTEPWQVHAFVFAWYAEHPKDTDYSDVGGK
jgi:hypothetical protein